MNSSNKSSVDIDKNKPLHTSLDIFSVIALLWAQKLLIISVVCLSVAISIWVALTQDEMYMVELKAVPSESSLAATDSSLLKTIGLRLDGFGAAVGEYEKHLVAVQVLRSTGFIYNFIDRHKLLPLLFGVSGWERSSDTLVWHEDIYDPVNKVWLTEERPTLQQGMQKVIMQHLRIIDDRHSRLLSVRFTHQSPIVAAQITNLLINDLNQHLKDKELKELDRKLSFYKTELINAKIDSTKATLATLIEQTTYNLLLKKTDSSFLFEVIDPPMIPELRSYPRRGLLVVIGVIFGSLLALILAFIKSLIYPPKAIQQKLSLRGNDLDGSN